MSFTLTQSSGDSGGPTDTGKTVISTGNSFVRINGSQTPINHNASVVPTTAPGTTPGDVSIFSGTLVYTDILAFSFTCTLINAQGSTTIPQAYIKLVGANGSSHDLVIPITSGQTFTYINPAASINSVHNTTLPNNTYDANGNAFTLESGASVILPTALAGNITSIVVTPDKYADLMIVGTVELAV